MATSRSIIKQELEKQEIPKNKVFPIITALSQLLVPKEEYADLEKDRNKTQADTAELLRLMHDQQVKILELQSQITTNKETGSSMQSDTHQFNIITGDNSKDVEEKEDTDSVMVMKRLQNDLGEKEKHIQKNEEQYTLLKMQIDKIKSRLGLTVNASMEELDAKIDDLCRKGVKEAENYKKQLIKQRKKIADLKDIRAVLEQEKSLLQKKLERKENELERLRSKRKAQLTIKSCNNFLNLRPQVTKTTKFPVINPPRRFADTNVVYLQNDDTCQKCNTHMNSAIYCKKCVDKTLYR